MKLVINSTKLGRSLEFTRPGSEYIYVDLNNQPGTLGIQPNKDGHTLTYTGDDYDEFSRICQQWYRWYTA